jgi:hypothetical protein
MGIRGQDATGSCRFSPRSLLTKGTAMKTFTLADVYYVCGIIFFVVATVYLLGANTMAVFN